MADGEDTWASYHSVVAGVRIIQQLGGPERLKVFFINDLNGREDLVYDSEMHPGTCLHHLRMVAHEFWAPLEPTKKNFETFCCHQLHCPCWTHSHQTMYHEDMHVMHEDGS